MSTGAVSLITLLTCAAVSACQQSKKPEAYKNSEAPSTDDSAPGAKGEENMAFALTSTAFDHEGGIPRKYTCEGEDVSPPLAWTSAPKGTESFALIVDDPDAPDPAAPKRVWVHWVLYNLPSDTTALSEAVIALPAGTLEGLNDWKRTGYGGPCPPIGRHRYFHKLFALDTVLADLGKPTKAELEAAMSGHILAQSSLIGTYAKIGR